MAAWCSCCQFAARIRLAFAVGRLRWGGGDWAASARGDEMLHCLNVPSLMHWANCKLKHKNNFLIFFLLLPLNLVLFTGKEQACFCRGKRSHRAQQWLRGKFGFASCRLVGGKTKFSSCGANTIKLLLLIKQPFHKLNSWLGAAQWFCWLPQAKVLCGERLMRQLVTN